MVFIKSVLVSVMLARAVYTDIREGRIENRLVGPGFLLGLTCAALENGMAGLWLSIKMVVIVIAVLFILFVIKGLGAGDIKLLSALAAFLPKDIACIVIAAFFAGAAISLGRMGFRLIKKLPVYKRGERLNFSVPIAAATALVEFYKLFV